MDICTYDVSIHAPVRGATIGGSTTRQPISGFNPRSRAGSDDKDKDKDLGSFNPRSRAGSDVGPSHAIMPMWSFNPRSRAGSDLSPDW